MYDFFALNERTICQFVVVVVLLGNSRLSVMFGSDLPVKFKFQQRLGA